MPFFIYLLWVNSASLLAIKTGRQAKARDSMPDNSSRPNYFYLILRSMHRHGERFFIQANN